MSLWSSYEPQPPRCAAILVTEENWDEVYSHFANEYHEGLVEVTQRADRKGGGGRTLTLKFESYEISVQRYQVIYRTAENDGRLAVMSRQEFVNTWRERLGS